jgi:hypothetical protein
MKLNDKLEKTEEEVLIKMLDNGYIVEVSGRDHDDEWATVKILCRDLEEVNNLVYEATTMKRV